MRVCWGGHGITTADNSSLLPRAFLRYYVTTTSIPFAVRCFCCGQLAAVPPKTDRTDVRTEISVWTKCVFFGGGELQDYQIYYKYNL